VAGVNYEPASGILNWANGDRTSKSFNVTVISNSLVQGDLTVGLAIFNPTGGATMGLRTNSTLTVVDASVGPGFLTFVSAAMSVDETATNAVITVLRTNGNLGAASVDYAAVAGTAVAGVNFAAVTGTLSYTNGQTSAVLVVPIFEQQGADLNKTVELSLFNPTNASLGAITNAELTILESQSVAGSVNFAFNPDLNGPVDAVYVQTNTDNKIVIAGSFTMAAGIPRQGMARLNANGSLDQVFDVGTGGNGPVRALAGMPDGRIYVGGAFTSFNGQPHNYLARLMPDGALDTTFTATPDNVVNAVAIDASGKLLIGGLFTAVGGQTRGYLARLQADGTLDFSFLAGRTGADGEVRVIVVQADGKILIAGDFSYINGLARPRVARLLPDGSVDTAFNPGTGPANSVRALAESDGAVLIGGLFESVAGTSRSHIARLLADGKLDQTFNPGAGADDYVSTVAVQPDGKILIGGAFTSFNGYRRNRLTRLNHDGAVDTTFNIGIGANNYVNVVVIQPDQRILVGGGFTTFNGQLPQYFARLNGGFNLGPGSFGFAVANFEVNENGSNGVVTVVRSIGTAGEVSVAYATSPGSAVAGVDYSPVSGTLHFADGETVQTFTVPIIDNLVPTRDRTIGLTLSNPTGGAELGAQVSATLTIIEDDGIIGFDQVNFSVNEGASNAVITVTRTAGNIGYASVDFSMTDGTAQNLLDYTNVSGTLVFTNGQIRGFIFVPIVDDAIIEGDETVSLALSNPTNTMLGRSNATLTIVDNDFGPGTLGFSVANYTVNENAGSVNITVRRTGGSLGAVSVNYTVSSGTATAGADFVADQNVLQFADGQVSKTFAVQILDDSLSEGNETVLLHLSNPQGGALLDFFTSDAVLTIMDNDVQAGSFRFLTTNFTAVEGSFIPGAVTVVRTNGSTGVVSVDFATSSGTAISDVDFIGVTNTLTFTNGEVSKVVYVDIIDDFAVEPTETVNLRLFNPRYGATLTEPSTATMLIFDNESSVSFGSASYSVNEDAGTALITVVRSGGTGSVVAVSYASGGGSALPGSDYSPVNGIVTFNPGETVKTVFLPITDNSITNVNKTVGLSLFGPSGGALVGSPSNTVVTILDNDCLISLSQSAYSVSESAGEAVITVRRSGSISVPASVNITVGGGTAVPGVQYTPVTNLTVRFAANQSQATVRVPVIGNSVRDGNRTVNITLSLPSHGAIITQGSAVLTILDDDNSIIVPVATLLLAENLTANQSIDPGETVTIRFTLRNIGNVTASNLVATLLATNGVTSPSAAQTFGVMNANGVSVSRPFTFTANAANGGVVTAVLKLQDGANDLGTVSVAFLVGRLTSTFANTNAIQILDDGAGSPYPSVINVANLNGSVSKVSVTLSNISHDFPRDIGVLLVGPAGQKIVLMSYAVGGWGYGLTNATLTFDDASTNVLPYESLVFGGTFRPTNYFNVPFPAPAPSAPTVPTALSVFNGTAGNGAWSLYVMDQNSGDIGRIAGGWSMAISTVQLFPSQADVAASVAAPASTTVDTAFAYTITVANGGPSDAQDVVATNTLPAGVQLVSTSVSQGTVTTSGSVVTARFGTMANGASATLTLMVQGANPGLLTNVVAVGSSVKDPATDNNLVRLVTSITPSTPPSLTGPGLSSGTFQLTIQGQVGTVYYIDGSVDLKTWTRLSTNTLSGTGGTFADPAAGNYKMRFYRVVMP
jgi:uncharacterized delta-60 repeat protein/uncharacterized repeat protein (TIGR01451 family)